MMKASTKCCNQCLFTDRKIVSDERRLDILEECREKNTHFICHKATMVGENVCCRGFYENETSQALQIAERLGFMEFVDVTKLEKQP